MILKIAEVFSKTPGGRFTSDGLFSAEEFRTRLLEPAYDLCLLDEEKLYVDLDGGYGYTAGFLEESFGGMVRHGYKAKEMLDNIRFISNEEPELIENIRGYIIDEGLRKGIELNRGRMII